MKTFEGKTALVTGGSAGIGRAIAVEFAARGARVGVLDLQPAPADSTWLHVRGDVSRREDVERWMEKALENYGSIDILVNNAAATVRKPLLELEVADVERVWGVSLWGVFHASQLAARQMARQGSGGSIISISSVHADRAFPRSSPYNAAKAAVNHLTRTWASELAALQIRVNAIEPGWILTPGERVLYTEEQIRNGSERIPLGRLGTPEEIAKVAAFLASPDASYITGSVIRADGGIVLPLPN